MNQAYALCVKTQIGWSTREPPFMFLQKGISLHPTSLIYYGVVRMANKDISLIVGVGDIHVETNLDYNWYSKCVACTGSSPQSYSARKVR